MLFMVTMSAAVRCHCSVRTSSEVHEHIERKLNSCEDGGCGSCPIFTLNYCQ